MPIQIAEHFYTLTEASKELGKTRETLWRWVKSGKLDAQHVGTIAFIPKDEVLRLKTEEKSS